MRFWARLVYPFTGGLDADLDQLHDQLQKLENWVLDANVRIDVLEDYHMESPLDPEQVMVTNEK